METDDLARLALFASVMSIAPDGIISANEEQLIIDHSHFYCHWSAKQHLS
jgi:energy-converting hydrogenase Eha subunit H